MATEAETPVQLFGLRSTNVVSVIMYRWLKSIAIFPTMYAMKKRRYEQLRHSIRQHLERQKSSYEGFKAQGDAELYTDENLTKRSLVKHQVAGHPILLEFWAICDLKKNVRGCLDRRSYFYLNQKMHFALVPDVSREEAFGSATEDWARDLNQYTRGCEELDFKSFAQSMVELADNWVTSINAEDYVAFLRQLLDAITCRSTEQERIFRPDAQVQRLVTYAAIDALEDQFEDEHTGEEEERIDVIRKDLPSASRPWLAIQVLQRLSSSSLFKNSLASEGNLKKEAKAEMIPCFVKIEKVLEEIATVDEPKKKAEAGMIPCFVKREQEPEIISKPRPDVTKSDELVIKEKKADNLDESFDQLSEFEDMQEKKAGNLDESLDQLTEFEDTLLEMMKSRQSQLESQISEEVAVEKAPNKLGTQRRLPPLQMNVNGLASAQSKQAPAMDMFHKISNARQKSRPTKGLAVGRKSPPARIQTLKNRPDRTLGLSINGSSSKHFS